MSIFASNSDHSLNPGEHKKRVKTYEKFQKAAIIITTVAGLSSFIYSNVDIGSIISFFNIDERVSRTVVMFVVPILSFFAGSVLGFYRKKIK